MVAPRVSVVIPAYNHVAFLPHAIRSALAQTLDSVEVIVVDDGSTDDTPAVAAEFGDRIVYIRQEKRGVSQARNTGIAAARGDLIQLLDADDALHPDCLERVAESAERHPLASVFTASWDEMDTAGATTGHADAVPLPEDTFHALFDPMLVGPACRYLFRRMAFAKAGSFDTALLGCEDWDMWLRMAGAGCRFVAVPEACVRYRAYSTSVSKNYLLMWSSGNRVLRRAAGTHGDCATCRQARRRGVARWREWCYVSMLAPALRAHFDQRRYYAAGRQALVAVAGDPKLAPFLVQSASTRRSAVRTQRAGIDWHAK